jgi:Asp-tRNA(Asn)/Glu-tRNA(Gln) amidotransferase A subunit family amidase
MCTLGTALDLPAINVPGLKGPHGMPLGMQLLGRRGDLSSLLHAAQWLQTTLGSRSS